MNLEFMDFLNHNVIQDVLFTFWDYLGCYDLYKMSTYWGDCPELEVLLSILAPMKD